MRNNAILRVCLYNYQVAMRFFFIATNISLLLHFKIIVTVTVIKGKTWFESKLEFVDGTPSCDSRRGKVKWANGQKLTEV